MDWKAAVNEPRLQNSAVVAKRYPGTGHVAAHPLGTAVGLEVAVDDLPNAGRIAHALTGNFPFPLGIEKIALTLQCGDFGFLDFVGVVPGLVLILEAGMVDEREFAEPVGVHVA